ncbi:unnamed protein product [Penicillium camemberti]|uniref:Str. FM013 n=1 Tax=Penicillium camemberti (strain FM 013) TaxID=1429867 RepID=A0A0G4P6I3_PENC3|nr:unnamed protein product [Penicillium camemberti]
MIYKCTPVTDGNMDRPRLVGYPFLEATVHILWRSSYEPAIYRKTHSVVVDLEDLKLVSGNPRAIKDGL